MMNMLPPFRMQPEFDARIWGCRDLSPWFDVKNRGELIGEVWLTGDACRAGTGPLAGLKLGQIATEYGAQLLGKNGGTGGFPLLIKMLFPRENLSVQVHPDDAMAQKQGELRGKSECWYVLEAKPEARLALGLKKGTTVDEVRQAIHDARLEELLEYVPISSGDMVYVDAGTVHAIEPGSVILETQQNSDITYRMYDYGRPRELHIEKSLEAMKLETAAGKILPRIQGDRTVLIDERYFRVEQLLINGTKHASILNGVSGNGLSILFVAKGAARVSGNGFESFRLGRSQLALIPAITPEWSLDPEGEVEVLQIVPKFMSNYE